jgi:uncharacterized damage-inducible protein DinB
MTSLAVELIKSQEFFNRSSRVLDEADSEFRPKPELMTAAQQVGHVAQTLDWFIEGASRSEGFNLDFDALMQELMSLKSLAAARQMLDKSFANAIAFLNAKTPEEMSKPLPDGPIMGGAPKAAIVSAMVEHTAHHRGVLTVYSRLLGKVPPMPYMD